MNKQSETMDERGKSFRGLEAERKHLDRRMREIGGSGSEKHGEFHTLRRSWADVVTQMGATVWKQLPMSLHRAQIVSRGYDYGPGGKQELCPYEKCDCEENPNRVRNSGRDK